MRRRVHLALVGQHRQVLPQTLPFARLARAEAAVGSVAETLVQLGGRSTDGLEG